MFKKMILGLALVSTVAQAGIYGGYQKHKDGYNEFHPQYNHPDVVKNYVYLENRAELRKKYATILKAVGGEGEYKPDEVKAFSVLHRNNSCTIYLLPGSEFETYKEHEEKHCQYGQWHD